MSYSECRACNKLVSAARPEGRSWSLIVSFWVFSLFFALGAVIGPRWGVHLVIAWVLLAIATGFAWQRATSWTCADCGSTVDEPPPLGPTLASA
ncbi:MAG TPA: hypothetical protein VM580_25450 [Labilithrix sp.]|nr:hypothetical protein [Labilithrix sp.]